MDDLGKYLRELREARGIEYSQIYSDIRIREDQIKLIEDNKFHELGNHGIVKAMLYNYSRYLGADVNSVLAEIKVLMPEKEIKRAPITDHGVKQKKIMLSTNFLWAIGIVVFVLILGSILFYAYRQGWLKTPPILKSNQADSTAIVEENSSEPEETKPDPTRERMRMLQESINAADEAPKPETKPKPTQKEKPAVVRDTTDYIDSLMGDSPVNISTD
jgi:cytoskeletal protein RodZ